MRIRIIGIDCQRLTQQPFRHQQRGFVRRLTEEIDATQVSVVSLDVTGTEILQPPIGRHWQNDVQ